MGEIKNATALVSATDTHRHHDAVEDCLEKDLPDLYPVNCHPKTFFAASIKSKDLDESSERTNDGKNSDIANGGSVTFSQSWACFIPFLWNSLWTGIGLFQSVVVAYVLQTFFNTDTRADVKLFRSVMSMEGGSTSSIVASSPPALLLLALLTLTVLVIHPDGFTWIALRKLRGSIMYLFESSTTCWAWVLNDFGAVVSTVLALTTFASLFFFCYLLHRTLRPRSNKKLEISANGAVTSSSSSQTQEKSRKKRRKGNKNRATNKTSSTRTEASSSVAAKSSSVVVELARSISDSARSSVNHVESFSSSASEKESSLPALQEDAIMQSQENYDIPEPPRLRIESLSTIDTISLDPSTEEASVGSGVSGGSTPQQPPSVESNARSTTTRPSRARKTRSSQPLRNPTTPRSRKSENYSKGKNTAAPSVVSRWDALKPVNNTNEMVDTKPTKGNRKNLQASASRSPQGGKQSTFAAKQNNPIATRQIAEAPGMSPPSNASVPPSHTVESFWYNDDNAMHTPDRNALMSSFLHDNDDTTTGWSLNPRSPSFTPSQTVSGLRPPPGLTPPSHAPPGFDKNPMEPLLLPPATPPPGLSSVPGLTLPSGCTSPSFMRPRENPFVDDEDEEQIANELQELGGQMVGSVLDF